MRKLKPKPVREPINMDWLHFTTYESESHRRIRSARRVLDQIKITLEHIEDALDDYFRRGKGMGIGFDVNWGKMLSDEVFTFCNEVARANGAALVRGRDPEHHDQEKLREHAKQTYLSFAHSLGNAIKGGAVRLDDSAREWHDYMNEAWLCMADAERGPTRALADRLCARGHALAHNPPNHYRYGTPEELLVFEINKGKNHQDIMARVIGGYTGSKVETPEAMSDVVDNVVSHGYIGFMVGRELIRAGHALFEKKVADEKPKPKRARLPVKRKKAP